MFRFFQIIIREFRRFLLNLLHFKIQFVFVNKVLWQHIVLCRNLLQREQLARCVSYVVESVVGQVCVVCCRECSWLGVRRMLQRVQLARCVSYVVESVVGLVCVVCCVLILAHVHTTVFCPTVPLFPCIFWSVVVHTQSFLFMYCPFASVGHADIMWSIYYYYYLLQFSCHSVAVVLTLVQTKQIKINSLKRNNKNTVNTSTHITITQ